MRENEVKPSISKTVHQQNRPAAVTLGQAFNFLRIVCHAVPLWAYAGYLGCWDDVRFIFIHWVGRSEISGT